jgi:hypothetical protein
MDDVLQLARWTDNKPDAAALLSPGRKPLTYGTLLPLLRQARSGIEFVSVLGDHDSMFSPKNASELANRIHACQTTACQTPATRATFAVGASSE